MITRNFEITLRIPETSYIPNCFQVTQNDKDVYNLEVHITDGVNEINYAQVSSATITFSKADGNVVQGDMTIGASSLTYTMGTNEIAHPGTVQTSVQLFGASGERLTSARFKFDVVKDLITPSAVQSTSEFPILQQLKQDLEAIDVVELTSEFNAHKAESAPYITDVLITVGVNGDFNTINEALESIYIRYPAYRQNGIKVEILLLSGFVMSEQVLIDGIDLGFITITSEDATVDINRAALTSNFISVMSDSSGVYPAFGVRNSGVMPRINVLFNMISGGDASGRHGFAYLDGGSGVIMPGAGCNYAGENGLFLINGARVLAYGAIFENSISSNVRVFRGSYANLRQAKVTGGGGHGIYMGSSSVIEALGINLSNNSGRGLWIYANGRANIRESIIENSGEEGIYCNQNVQVEASLSTIKNSAKDNVYATSKSSIDLRNAIIKNSNNNGVRISEGSTILLLGADVSENTLCGIRADNGATIESTDATINDNGSEGVLIEKGASFTSSSITITNNGTYGLFANRGCNVSLNNCNCEGNNHSTYDIRCSRGSIINMVDGRGRINLTENTITSDGIIFK